MSRLYLFLCKTKAFLFFCVHTHDGVGMRRNFYFKTVQTKSNATFVFNFLLKIQVEKSFDNTQVLKYFGEVC